MFTTSQSVKVRRGGLFMEFQFGDLRAELSRIIQSKHSNNHFPGEDAVILVDGFAALGLQPTAGPGAGMVIGGDSIPAVMVIGLSTGKIYHLSLLFLMPQLAGNNA